MAHDDDLHGRGGRHRSTAEETPPPWELPPTTTPVDAPPPIPADAATETVLPPGGWFRRRSADDLDVPPPPPSVPPPPPPVPSPPPTAPVDPVVSEPPSVPEPEPVPLPEAAPTPEPPPVLEVEPPPVVESERSLLGLAAVVLIGALAAAAVVVLWPTGADPLAGRTAFTDDVPWPLVGVAAALSVIAVAAARWRGLGAVLAVAGVIALLVFFTLPAITADDHPPLAVAGATAVASAVVAGVLTRGLGPRSTAAIIGTVIGVAAAALLGLASAELLETTDAAPREITSAAAVIAAAGILLDLTYRQARLTWRLRHQRPDDSGGALLRSSLHASGELFATSLVTLVLVFAGAALVALLAAADSAEGIALLTGPSVVIEFARVAVCGLAALVALPVTAWLVDRSARRVVASSRPA